ncbi:peptidoglycan -binding protein [Enhydrobacter sp.]|jgi:chemotaxis protein MotB|uniref:peptidoglycan -binding protein n=1 Tax=Enhydrobacter sp. TaxID=1894999 RepID=UPI002615BCC6|nr:peptidoglycan -binding protein [Enhydrobacter sp.]WIM13436.1 MAG: MotB-like protein [Enhydrobacter sp.]
MAAISARRAGAADYTWPGYVDALTTLLMVMIFLISVFSVAQFTLSNAVSNRDSAIDALNRQVSTLADQLSFQKKSAEDLQKDVAALTLQISQLKAERDKLSTSNVALQQAAKVAEDKSLDLQKESERQKLEMTRLAAALAAANDEKGKLFSDLSDQEKLSAEQKANIVRLAAELASVKDELAKLSAQLDAADAKAKDQQAQIVDLGQKLNRALASKVEELARYRSEFFGKLRQALAGQRDVQIVGDRFVFQSEVLFPSGSADLQPGGEKQLASVAQRLLEIGAKIPKDIQWVLQVDGHTDTKPINTAEFPSNWELSAARAIAVVKFLHKQGIPYDHLVAAGYGQYQPISATDNARNRRIELKLTNR